MEASRETYLEVYVFFISYVLEIVLIRPWIEVGHM
jgi:hypothetical protein